MSVVLIDTSVFCNIVPVPGRDQNHDAVFKELKVQVQNRATLLLPMAAVLETGNHIAQVGNGVLRRKAANSFCKLVKNAIDGEAPWTPAPLWEMESLLEWLVEFPEIVLQKKGLGDLSVINEWKRQCRLHKARRVLIWSFDGHLAGFDRLPLL